MSSLPAAAQDFDAREVGLGVIGPTSNVTSDMLHQEHPGHGYNGTSFPTGGAGFDLAEYFGVDVGLFSTRANLERTRHLAFAVSLRFMHRNE